MTHHEVMLRQLRRLGNVLFSHRKNGWVISLCRPGIEIWLAGTGETVPAAIRDAYFRSLKDLAALDHTERMAA